MGVLNVTPDSFSDGGQFLSVDAAMSHAMQMVKQGVDIIDVGGESTRPAAAAITPEMELERVLPVISIIREASPDVCISIDTSAPEVMQSAAELGVDLINDVRALRREGALKIAAQTGLHVCLMHMKGDPGTMQLDPRYKNLIPEINQFFGERISSCEQAGIARHRILLDPGFGFGKTPEHNMQIINRLSAFLEHRLPLLVGLSRKSTIARITEDLLSGSVAGAVIASANGAKIVRVHDVAETVSALRMSAAISRESLEERE
jgi:dihydropteroate synthase